MTYQSVKEINDFLKYNVVNPPKIEHSTKLSLQDIRDLKNSRDYLNNIYMKYTQTLRNDTYISNKSICINCKQIKETFKILCYDCATKE